LLFFCLASLLCLHLVYQKYKKIVPFIVVTLFICFSLARMSIPEVEVRSFKPQSGESLKDAWYRISNAHHRCTKLHRKYSQNWKK
jgi:hypothetical protein